MDVKSYIDEFLQLIKDPRNVSPHEFSKYYPDAGELGNSNNLSKEEIEKHYSNLLRFNAFEGYAGYISLKSRMYLILDSFRQLKKKEQEIVFNYYVLKAKEEDHIDLVFASKDKILSKEEYHKLLGIYMVFLSSIKKVLLDELKFYLDTQKEDYDVPKFKTSYLRIFSSPKSFELWERLTEDNKGYAYRSYMYRMMLNEKLILVGDAEFRNWLSDIHEDEPLDRTKPLPKYHSKEREKIYYDAKQLIKEGK